MEKVEFSHFYSEDPQGWIAKAHLYFHLFRTLENGKVDLAALQFEGDANDWLELFFADHPVPTWLELVVGVKEAFGPSKVSNPNELLASIR